MLIDGKPANLCKARILHIQLKELFECILKQKNI